MPGKPGRVSPVWPWIPVAGATAALVWIVPASPFAHLDDPSHWGVIGYGVTVLLLVLRRLRGRGRHFPERDLLAAFLAAMPVIYLADWLRFDGSSAWIAVEAAGALAFWALAWLGAARSPWFLAVGIAGHALWDVWHFGNVTFVPDWYVLACAVVDPALGVYAAARLRAAGVS